MLPGTSEELKTEPLLLHCLAIFCVKSKENGMNSGHLTHLYRVLKSKKLSLDEFGIFFVQFGFDFVLKHSRKYGAILFFRFRCQKFHYFFINYGSFIIVIAENPV